MKSYKLVLLALLAVACASLSACSLFTNQTYTFPAAGAATPVTITGFGAWCENNLQLIQSSTKTTITATAGVFVTHNSAKVASIVADVKYASSILTPLLEQSSLSSSDVDAALTKISVNDPSGIIADIIAPAIQLASGYLVQLTNESAPSRVAHDVINAVVNGLNDAVSALSA